MKKLLRRAAAFTLLELSIVIVIIALLIGGILSGNALIAAAELRSVSADAQSYINAIGTFRSQYRYLPGDMPTATKYWSTTTPGNGDGVITGDERFYSWHQLSLAGLTDATYTGATNFTIGTTVPGSRFGLAGFSLFYDAAPTSPPFYYAGNYGNTLAFGMTATSTTIPPLNPALTATEAYNIDKKVDDGKPGTGKWIALSMTDFGETNTCSTSTNNTDYTGEYKLTRSTIVCAFLIPTGY